jgi:hypothetical protein
MQIIPEIIPAVDPEQFEKAFDVYHDALTGKIRNADVGKQQIHIEDDETGDVDVLTFTDCPLNQAVFAVKKFVGLDTFIAVMVRLFALTDVMHANKPKIVKQGGIPAEWVEIAATLPIKKFGAFDASKFVWPEEEAA